MRQMQAMVSDFYPVYLKKELLGQAVSEGLGKFYSLMIATDVASGIIFTQKGLP